MVKSIGEKEEASFAEEAVEEVKKGDFEQTLEVSLNDTPADVNILHSQASILYSFCSLNCVGLACTMNVTGECFIWDMSRHLQ